mmetsp:Transcript_137785/g.384182  ORF Transcript_137785/g.384182 Transcript_137785/m.384182 type:complete len:122 (-) Transcript_137785:114-479(-)
MLFAVETVPALGGSQPTPTFALPGPLVWLLDAVRVCALVESFDFFDFDFERLQEEDCEVDRPGGTSCGPAQTWIRPSGQDQHTLQQSLMSIGAATGLGATLGTLASTAGAGRNDQGLLKSH